jgi:hypothetical protein
VCGTSDPRGNGSTRPGQRRLVTAASTVVRRAIGGGARIDPETNRVVERYGPAVGSGSVAADDDAVWVTAHDVRKIWRLPLR